MVRVKGVFGPDKVSVSATGPAGGGGSGRSGIFSVFLGVGPCDMGRSRGGVSGGSVGGGRVGVGAITGGADVGAGVVLRLR